MSEEKLLKIIRAFSDLNQKILKQENTLVFSYQGEAISIETNNVKDVLFVKEGHTPLEIPAEQWVRNRLARLDILANCILESVENQVHFVDPDGELIDEISNNPSETKDATKSVMNTLHLKLDKSSTWNRNILYLTSDAGEGKTTVINHLAILQAKRYKQGESFWLLLPIDLGGRSFMKFDDIIIARLINKYRFIYLYWNSFIQLVNLGYIVPAFDGYEEMFIQESPDDAITALGNFISNLIPPAKVLISARKTYFDEKNLAMQARLYDSLDSDEWSFLQVTICRWSRLQFEEYCTKRGFHDSVEIYDAILTKLGNPDHPLLTRAYLVKCLLDLADNSLNLIENVIPTIDKKTDTFFSEFIDKIIQREVSAKWRDRSDEVTGNPILSLEEHHKLLSIIAEEMWISSTNFVSSDIIELCADTLSEDLHKTPLIAQQIRERTKQHAMLIKTGKNRFSFDHDEFRDYFLGISISEYFQTKKVDQIRNILYRGILPSTTITTLISEVKSGMQTLVIVNILNEIINSEYNLSSAKDNCGLLLLSILDNEYIGDFTIKKVTFLTGSLSNKTLKNVIFEECYFKDLLLDNTTLINCSFKNCEFYCISLNAKTNLVNNLFDSEIPQCLVILEHREKIYNPDYIRDFLNQKGLKKVQPLDDDEIVQDKELAIIEKVLNKFKRAGIISERVLSESLGHDSNTFIIKMLPDLIKHRVITSIPNWGDSKNNGYRLGVKMEDVYVALKSCKGIYKYFLEIVSSK